MAQQAAFPLFPPVLLVVANVFVNSGLLKQIAMKLRSRKTTPRC